uniref:Zinc finger C2HC-type containing 1C n=1 Tax=Anser brachyrhynchus TaxID=132585 RepID=A0A8B9BLV5_9AVES
PASAEPLQGSLQGELGQCSFCGRKFLCSRLKKHTSICSKSQGSKRKVFDSSKARARGTDCSDCVSLLQNKPPRRNNWRQKHEVFIQTLRQARQVQQVLSKGGKASDVPPLPPIENPDYVACPYCRRRFAPQVAERHVPKCKTIKSRPPSPPGTELEEYQQWKSSERPQVTCGPFASLSPHVLLTFLLP